MRRWKRAGFLCFLVTACASSDPVASVCRPSTFRSSPPQVIAHAGGEGLGPANTLLALRRSLDAGADILDVDVRMTSDGVVVTAHDRSLEATTGFVGNVDETSWADVRRLDTRRRMVRRTHC